MTKRFLLDTNVLLHDPCCLEVFADNEVIIPISVLDELDQIKARPDEKGRNARSVIRRLDEFRTHGSLSAGVVLPSGSTVRVELNHQAVLPSQLTDTVDNRLIRTAFWLQADNGGPVIIVTKDINLRVKCDALGIKAQDYERDKLAKPPSALYTGFRTVFVPSTTIDELYANRSIVIEVPDAHINEFVLLQSVDREKHSGIGRVVGPNCLVLVIPPNEIWGIRPRNLEQKLALSLLMDPEIKLVTIVGRAGSGKTLMAAAAALHQTVEKDMFQRALLSRPVQPLGRDIGFLPGTVEEKLAPWMAALNDSLELLFAKDIGMLDTYKRQGVIQVEPLTYIRGRSIPNSFMIVDECLPYNQNVMTQNGKRPIGVLYDRWRSGKSLPRVWSFNENTKSFEWREITHAWYRGKHKLMSFRCANRTVRCTPEHRFLTVDGWRKASDLRLGDIMLMSVDENHPHQTLSLLTPDQKQIVLGSFLGDGHLSLHGRGRYRLSVTHGIEQSDYCAWKAGLFKTAPCLVENNGFAQKPAYKFRTPMFVWERGCLPTGKNKHCPQEVLDNLDARGLAIWFMDDGLGYADHGLLHTCDFDQVSQDRFVNKLQTMGIECHKTCHNGYSTIYISSRGMMELRRIIAPFCHPSMAYKLSGVQLGGYEWRYEPCAFGATIVDAINVDAGEDDVYDLEVEGTHTFLLCSSSKGKHKVCSGIVTHNCQNLTLHEIKTIVTRIGEGSKIVLTGDVEQIDNPFVDFASNGLTNAIERLKDYEITGHVTLNKCERSELAELAAEAL